MNSAALSMWVPFVIALYVFSFHKCQIVLQIISILSFLNDERYRRSCPMNITMTFKIIKAHSPQMNSIKASIDVDGEKQVRSDMKTGLLKLKLRQQFGTRKKRKTMFD